LSIHLQAQREDLSLGLSHVTDEPVANLFIVERRACGLRVASQRGRGTAMNEHHDDLESTVDEGAEKEVDAYPNTGDELDEPVTDETKNEKLDLDDDEAEL